MSSEDIGRIIAAINGLSDRMEKRIEDMSDSLRKDLSSAIALHSATCATKKKVDDAENQAAGAKAVLIALVALVSFLGGMIGPHAAALLAKLFGGGS